MFKTDAVRYTKHKRLFLIIPNYNTRYIYLKNNIFKQFINILLGKIIKNKSFVEKMCSSRDCHKTEHLAQGSQQL